ncbi:hypothetical protein PF005_g30734 [Phytophthora fragariae]|uniref:Uncharacterized protein n=1 Tax=Phytophthora fragariae TaxID=53985 RepID=A0A6A3VC68_9STRA|nr:hypothetical protein PF009_g30824 [Phytophthora fragariae]KAE9060068.1 hypothetical protein PF007_g30734 [Phytophthora fragariae]KAE9064469.1 hypothetical protein PF006_g30686 [Phytophthora fragariae]KAE9162730.1 hypothetical protein PF005_g30734 [Phytophthora fragariae]KAE9165796.1 hypothetical protein PF002_g31277 [Phytophthora fragariae]
MLKHFGGNVYRADDDGAKFGNYIYQHNKSVDLGRLFPGSYTGLLGCLGRRFG